MSAFQPGWVKRWLLVGLLLGVSPLLAGEDHPQIQNAGFEDPQHLAPWKQWVYADGKAPVICSDDREFKEGRRALLVQAEDPADVALGQTISLPAGSVWQARCWIKTENLQPRDATDTTGALHIQTPAGATLARGPSTLGTADWKDTAVVFRVPAEGEVKLTLFFVGYGKGRGKVWFDDVRLEPVAQAGRAAIRISAERLGVRPIDAKQGGQFIEPLCNLIPSLLSQQVANTSFEDDPPWKVAFRREVDKPYRPWYPEGAVHLARYGFDTNHPFNGLRSLRIDLPVSRARQASHYFDGASGPASAEAGATAKALELVLREPDLRRRLRANASRLRAALRELGLPIPDGPSAQFGVSIGTVENMRGIHEGLKARGIMVPYIKAYSGTPAEGVLRFAVFANHTVGHLDRLVAELRDLL